MKINLEEFYDMNDYKQKVEAMTEPELLKERDKIAKKLNLNYTFMGLGYYNTLSENIADNPDEKNRVYNRKKIAVLSKYISSKINKFADNMQDYWLKINKVFLDSVDAPDYADAKLKGKNVTFANRLSLYGMIAYKKYLMFVYDNMGKFENFDTVTRYSLSQEREVDKDFDRYEFFSRKFLPENQEAITKNLLKEKLLREKIKKSVGYEKLEETK